MRIETHIPSHPILSCADSAAWEKRVLANSAAEWTAMGQAGAAIAGAVLDDYREIGGFPDEGRVLVLAGKGHNGGDAMLAAREILVRHPHAIAVVVLFFGQQKLRPLARRSLGALSRLGRRRVAIVSGEFLSEERGSFAVCLDGVFGFQFRPPVDPTTAALLARVNSHPRISLRAAVDLPSGLGTNNGKVVFRADFTYATGIVKTPVVDEANGTSVGRLRYLDLGFFEVGRVLRDEPVLPNTLDRILLPAILKPLARLRPAHSDKRTYGHLLVIGGSRNYPGAVLMCAQAALRSGVGLLTACVPEALVPEALVPEYAARLPEIMWHGWKENHGGGLAKASLVQLRKLLSRASAVVIGPGMGDDPATIRSICELVTHATCPILLDADALRPEVIASAKGKRFICTPHAGEFKRIAGDKSLREFCRTHHAVMAKKGSPTVLSDGSATYYSLFGGPVLARGGSGDLLAGLTAGLLAQNPDDVLLAACRGVVWHGLAADLLARDRGQVAVQTTQLLDYLNPALHVYPTGFSR